MIIPETSIRYIGEISFIRNYEDKNYGNSSAFSVYIAKDFERGKFSGFVLDMPSIQHGRVAFIFKVLNKYILGVNIFRFWFLTDNELSKGYFLELDVMKDEIIAKFGKKKGSETIYSSLNLPTSFFNTWHTLSVEYAFSISFGIDEVFYGFGFEDEELGDKVGFSIQGSKQQDSLIAYKIDYIVIYDYSAI